MPDLHLERSNVSELSGHIAAGDAADDVAAAPVADQIMVGKGD